MPELPEVEALTRYLREFAVGHAIASASVAAIAALKTFDPPLTDLAGRQIVAVHRQGKFIDLDAAGVHLVFHLARAGWLRWYDEVPKTLIKPGKSPIALRVRLDDGSGFDLTEAGTKKSLAVYVVRDPAEIPGIARLGPDPTAPDFSPADFAEILRDRRTRIKGLLRDQSVFAGVGNAYSDEILHTAKMSPYALAAKLGPDDVENLYHAMRGTLRAGDRRGIRQATRRAEGQQAQPHAGARAHRPGLPGVRRHRARGHLRRLDVPVLPDVPDRRQAARRPRALAPPEVTGDGADF